MSETCKIESLVAYLEGNLLGTSFRLLLNKEGYKEGLSSQSTPVLGNSHMQEQLRNE